jgi:hypothetical protein
VPVNSGKRKIGTSWKKQGFLANAPAERAGAGSNTPPVPARPRHDQSRAGQGRLPVHPPLQQQVEKLRTKGVSAELFADRRFRPRRTLARRPNGEAERPSHPRLLRWFRDNLNNTRLTPILFPLLVFRGSSAALPCPGKIDLLFPEVIGTCAELTAAREATEKPKACGTGTQRLIRRSCPALRGQFHLEFAQLAAEMHRFFRLSFDFRLARAS